MSIWGKLIGGVAGFALGGPLGAILGTVFGHAVDRKRAQNYVGTSADSLQTRQTAFTVAVVVLSAKMAKADGQVTRDEVDAFKRIFEIPENEMRDVGRLFDEARQDADGFEPYAEQIGDMFAHDAAVRESLLGGLFQIALADGVVHPNELAFLKKVARAFGLDNHDFDRIQSAHMGTESADPYQILGVSRDTSDEDIKKTYRNLSRENHPDTLIAKGMPQEFVDVANEKMASINAAYDVISKERSL
ncbi:MAG: DnaJ domain-containing protein [Rhodospirillaceae bacterium]|nr:DnaJ domain-containing protein [Rhodospirillaceae bacterium]MBT4588358.1 DnaJ domain-containing protein [Rhodospirillaceae bacterium]MBT4940203.1 DnaJ domain-containing protein [Rhodospirillaceae bacterium]MBT7266063.1 DnaJ domain-containing protein [Rhodospirillaceae bacterium]